MNLHINNWSGRLGNNIIQLTNAIKIALYYNYNIIIPHHTYFTTTYIIINDTINKTDNKINDTHQFFYQDKIKNIDNNVFNENIDKTLQILKQNFTIKNILPLNENDLIIHIRGGDIFNNNPYQHMILPPLSYYVNIINNNDFDKIMIISEDTKNPCINKLLTLYPNIQFKKKSLDNDIKLILSAKHVIQSHGTFIPSLLLLSDNIINIYKPSYDFTTIGYNIIKYKLLTNTASYKINIFEINLDEYYKKQIPWKNSPAQINTMLTY